MKIGFTTTFASIALFATWFQMGYAATTSNFLAQLAPPKCINACSDVANNVGTCLENLNATLTASINTSDPSSFHTDGNWEGVRNCLCSDSAMTAGKSCLRCLSEQSCVVADKPLTVEDWRGMCISPKTRGILLYNRYHQQMSCPSHQGGGDVSSSSSPTVSPTSSVSPSGSSSSSESASTTTVTCSSSSDAPPTTIYYHRKHRGGARR